MVVKGCGKGCKSRLFLAKKELGVNLFGVDMGCVVGGYGRKVRGVGKLAGGLRAGKCGG